MTDNLVSRDDAQFYQDPEHGMTHRLMSNEVKQAIVALPNEFRAVVVLADLLGFPYKDVALVLGCPVGTVMSRLFRGRKQMRRHLVDKAYRDGVIRSREPYLRDATNRTRLRPHDEDATNDLAENE